MTNRLTLNLGLRYEFRGEITDSNGRVSALRDPLHSTDFTIGPIMTNPTYKNWSPRLGFAWDVFGNGKTAIRGGFGIYYDVANLGALLTQNPTGTLPWVANTTATWSVGKGPDHVAFELRCPVRRCSCRERSRSRQVTPERSLQCGFASFVAVQPDGPTATAQGRCYRSVVRGNSWSEPVAGG